MKSTGRFVMRALLASIWIAMLQGSASAAAPAKAAKTIFIDDSRDGVQCPGALDEANLYLESPFPVQSGQTITFCSGEYYGTLFIDGLTNVKVTGKADPILGMPRIIPAKDPGSLGTVFPDLISITDSSNITVSGLILDGGFKGQTDTNWNTAVHTMSGIHVTNSSVTVSNNIISRIRPSSTAPEGTSILADGDPASLKKLKILHNIISDFNWTAIKIDGAFYQPAITRNMLLFTRTPSSSGSTGISLTGMTSGTVSANALSTIQTYLSGSGSLGIDLGKTQNMKVSANKIDGISTGIGVGNTNGVMAHNTISGNTIVGADIGIEAGTVSGVLVHNTISRNTILNTRLGIQLLTLSPIEPSISNTVISGNKIMNYVQAETANGIFVSNFAATGVKGFASTLIFGNTILGYGANTIVLHNLNEGGVKIGRNKTGYSVP